MKTKWRVHRSQRVTRYLIGLRETGRGIRQAIDFLTQYGIPANADKDETAQPPTYTWMAAGHIITCLVSEVDQAIYVAEIEPMDIEPA